MNAREMKLPSDKLSNLFFVTVEKFRDALSEEDKKCFKCFKSAHSMVADIRKEVSEMQKNSTLLMYCTSIETIANKWEPFFEIVNILVSTHPELSGLFWGAIRLVFKVCQQYSSFFEKLVRKFDEITGQLCIGTEHVNLVIKLRTTPPIAEDRLAQQLACVYEDAISFCQQIYKIFSSRSKGVIRKFKFVGEALWIPFDTRFGRLLNRIDRSASLLDQELRLADTTILVSAHEKLEELAEAWKHLELEEGKTSERISALSATDVLKQLRLWVSSPFYMTTFERAKQMIEPGTCEWFLVDPRFQGWLAQKISPAEDYSATFHTRILTILGAPGYGKTILSTKVIDHLQSRTKCSLEHHQLSSAICFYHFTMLSREQNEPHHALRGLLDQILYQCQDDYDLLDAASLVIKDSGSGQMFASEIDIETILTFAFRAIDECVLVIDGVDECSDSAQLLKMLHKVCQNAKCKIILFSRPDLVIPVSYNGGPRIRLSRTANLDDIRIHVLSRAVEMEDTGLMPPEYSAQILAEQIVTQSNSIFLWAKLTMAYLESSFLSPRARREAIQDMVSLAGMDAIYSKILESIGTRALAERAFVFKIFQWLVAATRPLRLSELRIVSAIRFHKATCPELDYIPDMETALVRHCGSLVEVSEDGAAHFIHLSVLSFLTGKWDSIPPDGPGKFYIDTSLAHMSLANHCLSYLIYDVPASPLAGSIDTVADRDMVQLKFQFLEYSATMWNSHAAQGLHTRDKTGSTAMLNAFTTLMSFLSSFVSVTDKLRLWIEASWLFSSPPDIRALISSIDEFRLHEYNLLPDRPEDFVTLQVMQLLLQDLSAMCQEWDYVLKDEPQEIWDTNIGTFTLSTMFGDTNSAKLLGDALAWEDCPYSRHEEQSMSYILASEISHDQSQVAVVTLIPSTSFTNPVFGFFPAAKAGLFHKNMDQIWKYLEIFSHAWQLTYQLEGIGTRSSAKKSLTIELPRDEVIWALSESIYNGRSGSVRIPVSFSPDLTDVSFLHTILRISRTEEPNPSFQSKIQRLETASIDQLHMATNQSIPLTLPPTDLWLKTNWFQTHFSPTGTFFAAVRKNSVLIFEDRTVGTLSEPSFEVVAEIEVYGKTTCIFHHVLPIICVSHDEGTYLSDFKMSDKLYLKLSDQAPLAISTPCPVDKIARGEALELPNKSLPIRVYDPSFSSCGQYILFSVCRTAGSAMEIEKRLLSSMLNTTSIVDDASLQLGNDCTHVSDAKRAQEFVNRIGELTFSQDTRVVQRVNRPFFYETEQSLHMGVLKYDSANGTFFYMDVDCMSNVRYAKLLRLPKSIQQARVEVSLINPAADPEWLHIIINKGSNSVYDLQDETFSNMSFPILIERRKRTIPTYTQLRPMIGMRTASRLTEDQTSSSTNGSEGKSEHGLEDEMDDEVGDESSTQSNDKCSWLSEMPSQRRRRGVGCILGGWNSGFGSTFVRRTLSIDELKYEWLEISTERDSLLFDMIKAEIRLLQPKVEWCAWLHVLSRLQRSTQSTAAVLV